MFACSGITYVLSGLSMGVSGLLAASQLSSAQAQMEPSIVFDVIAIVVLGGTSLAGGVGSVWQTAVGLAIVATISNGFTLLGLHPYYQNIVKGAVIIFAVALEGVAHRRSVASVGTKGKGAANDLNRGRVVDGRSHPVAGATSRLLGQYLVLAAVPAAKAPKNWFVFLSLTVPPVALIDQGADVLT